MKSKALKLLLVLLITGVLWNVSQSQNHTNATVHDISVNLAKINHTMAGGIGASWHAMGPNVVHYTDLIGRDNRTCKGSAYGGNPPAVPAFDKAWDDVRRHASWLGLDFIRVEIAMEMYEPERERFVWDNDEMKTLYRILDHCQKNNVDVYMSMMWQGVEWNAHPGINRLQSSPKSVTDFAISYATLLDYLVKAKGYSCIHWITVNNEPGMDNGWWIGSDAKPDSIMPAIRAMSTELNKRGLKNIALCGPDSHQIKLSNFKPNDPSVGALAIHNYYGNPNETFAEGVQFAKELNLPFFVAEMGTFFSADFEGDQMAMGGPRSEASKSYEHQMINAEKILVGLNMGVDGFSRWSFVNRGDLDGQWQLVRTWNPNLWDFKRNVEPEPVPYYSFGIITRFAAKHSDILETKADSGNYVVAALKSPKGETTIYILNKSDKEIDISLSLLGLTENLTLNKYQVTQQEIQKTDFKLIPVKSFNLQKKANILADKSPPLSITTYSTYNLGQEDAGIIDNK